MHNQMVQTRVTPNPSLVSELMSEGGYERSRVEEALAITNNDKQQALQYLDPEIYQASNL